MGKTVLTKHQQDIFAYLSKQALIREQFYFGGGTVLAECYLHHRLSEDLDFFSETEFSIERLQMMMKGLSKKFSVRKAEYRNQFHRHLYFLEFTDNEILKMEFTYFPFERIDKKGHFLGLSVDSLLDIAVNKVHTIASQARSRDFIDLYCILQKKAWSIDELLKLVRIKYDVVIDYAQLGKQFFRVTELKDYPKMLISLKPEKWQKYFLQLAKGFGDKLLK